MTFEPVGRSLSDFTVELEVYSGPYEWLLALILEDELEIFEVPLRELVESYLLARRPDAANGLERDTDFAGSAAALILLKSRTLTPAADADAEGIEEDPLSPVELAERLTEYLKIRRAAEHLRARFASNAGHYVSAHTIPPRQGSLSINPDRVALAAGPVSFERITSDMDRMNRAVAFAAALSLAQEGSLTLAQTEPLGPLTLEPSR